jgi:hypothetical protein
LRTGGLVTSSSQLPSRRLTAPGSAPVMVSVEICSQERPSVLVANQIPPRRGERPDPSSRPPEGRGYHATSTNGLDFVRVADVQLEGRRRWLGNAHSDGAVITFFGTDDSGPARPGQPRGRAPWMGA